jgi:hypothetical protein
MELAHKEGLIRERAYALWEQEGRPDGREWDHWERASREIVGTPRTIDASSDIKLDAAIPQRRGRKIQTKGKKALS